MLETDLSTALAVIASGVVVPVVTAVLTRASTPAWVKRFLPVLLAVLGAFVVVFVNGGFTAVSLSDYVLLVASVVGLAQTIYAAMPAAWKALRDYSTPRPADVENK